MIYSLNGKLVHEEPNVAVIECSGVGYKCTISMSTKRDLPQIGKDVKLFTFLNVNRDGALDLFGFSTESEMNCFKSLTSVSGVGPKFAVSLLSEFTPEQVALAVASKDVKTLTRASGVGKKIAERIILELRDKLSVTSSSVADDVSPKNLVSASNNVSEAINALSMLGYVPTDVAPVVAKFDSSLSVEELIRLTLKTMARGL